MLSAQSYQVSDDKLYVDDVFSAYTYIGNGSAQTINNGIDLAGKGGMVWVKSHTTGYTHNLQDTVRGYNKFLNTDTTQAQTTSFGEFASFNSNGFGLGPVSAYNGWNTSADSYTSWTFRKAPKFFDVVTYMGNGAAGRQIPHALGIAPGMVIVKCTDAVGYWAVKHKDANLSTYIYLAFA